MNAVVKTFLNCGRNALEENATASSVVSRFDCVCGAAVTVNGRPAFRLGTYFFGGDDFDNSESGGFAELVAYAAKAQTDDEGGDAEDFVSCVTGRVYVARSAESFEYDADGNQTLVTTATGRWRVEYDGENRPVRWTREDDGKTVSMGYDHLGRRRTKDGVRFYYDGYLQVANERTVSNEVVRESFVWDPTEPVATRLLAWVGAGGVACGGVRVRRRRARAASPSSFPATTRSGATSPSSSPRTSSASA